MSVGKHIDEKEVNLVYERAKIEHDVATKIVETAAKLREEYKNGDLPYAPSIGDLVNWGMLIADGTSIEKAADETLIALTSDDPEVQDDVRKVLRKFFEQENED